MKSMIENIVDIMIKKRQHNEKAHIMTFGANTRFIKPYMRRKMHWTVCRCGPTKN